jgi:hypothetical protein
LICHARSDRPSIWFLRDHSRSVSPTAPHASVVTADFQRLELRARSARLPVTTPPPWAFTHHRTTRDPVRQRVHVRAPVRRGSPKWRAFFRERRRSEANVNPPAPSVRMARRLRKALPREMAMRKASLVVAAMATLMLAGCSIEAPDDAGDDEDVATDSDALTSAEKTAYEFFVDKGLKPRAAAAIVGNLIQESSVDPNAVQFGGGPGRGIAQWSVGGRWNHDSHDNVKWYAAKHGKSIHSLKLQLQFIWYELQTYSDYGLSKLKAADNVTEATIAFEVHFEGCGTCDQAKRIKYAKQVLNAWGP